MPSYRYTYGTVQFLEGREASSSCVCYFKVQSSDPTPSGVERADDLARYYVDLLRKRNLSQGKYVRSELLCEVKDAIHERGRWRVVKLPTMESYEG